MGTLANRTPNGGHCHEPLLVFVDDEKYQRDMRYYEMRLQKHPGRNILLFENTEEAIEFVQFATEKQLYLGAVVLDFDNRPVSETRGSKVLEAAIEYGKTRNHPVVKLLISSDGRPIGTNHPLNKDFGTLTDSQKAVRLADIAANAPLEEFNNKDIASDQQKVKSFVKNDHEIIDLLSYVKPTPPENEKIELIPDLVYRMQVMDVLIDKFEKCLEPYKALKNGEQTLGEIYQPFLEVIAKAEERIEDMLKIWALIRHWEEAKSRETGAAIPNDGAQQPEEPINIRTFGQFCLNEFKQIQKELGIIGPDLLTFQKVREALTDSSQADEEHARKVVHNLKSPFFTFSKLLEEAGVNITAFLKNKDNALSENPEPNEHRFTHTDLLQMIASYRQNTDSLRFFYVDMRTSRDAIATRDRTPSTHGGKAPTRQTIEIPLTDYENTLVAAAGEIKPDRLARYEGIVRADMDIITSAGNTSTLGARSPREKS